MNLAQCSELPDAPLVRVPLEFAEPQFAYRDAVEIGVTARTANS